MVILQKYGKIEQRYEELQQLLADPEIIKDQKQYQKIAKEFSDITPIVTLLRECREMAGEIEGLHKLLQEKMKLLKVDKSFALRYLNEGFSGGEKKRMEILQMAVLQPNLSILDETDSGLDIDALRAVAEGINDLKGR